MVNTKNSPRAYSEVYSFINALGESYIKKIPVSVYNVIKDNRDMEYNPKFDRNQKITNGMISKEGLALISAINLQYWCKDENEKKELKKTYINNAKQEEEKYSYENIFKNNNVKTNHEINEEKNIEEDNTELVEYKESIIKKIFNKIKDFFMRNNK